MSSHTGTQELDFEISGKFYYCKLAEESLLAHTIGQRDQHNLLFSQTSLEGEKDTNIDNVAVQQSAIGCNISSTPECHSVCYVCGSTERSRCDSKDKKGARGRKRMQDPCLSRMNVCKLDPCLLKMNVQILPD